MWKTASKKARIKSNIVVYRRKFVDNPKTGWYNLTVVLSYIFANTGQTFLPENRKFSDYDYATFLGCRSSDATFLFWRESYNEKPDEISVIGTGHRFACGLSCNAAAFHLPADDFYRWGLYIKQLYWIFPRSTECKNLYPDIESSIDYNDYLCLSCSTCSILYVSLQKICKRHIDDDFHFSTAD